MSNFAFAAPSMRHYDMTYDSDKFWNFVNEHMGDDPAKLRLRYHGDAMEVSITYIELLI